MTRGWTKAGLEGTCLRRDKRDEAGGRAGLAELHMRHVEHVSADGLHARLACTRTGEATMRGSGDGDDVGAGRRRDGGGMTTGKGRRTTRRGRRATRGGRKTTRSGRKTTGINMEGSERSRGRGLTVGNKRVFWGFIIQLSYVRMIR